MKKRRSLNWHLRLAKKLTLKLIQTKPIIMHGVTSVKYHTSPVRWSPLHERHYMFEQREWIMQKADISDNFPLGVNVRWVNTVSFCFWELFKLSKSDFPEGGRHVWDTFILSVINARVCSWIFCHPFLGLCKKKKGNLMIVFYFQ